MIGVNYIIIAILLYKTWNYVLYFLNKMILENFEDNCFEFLYRIGFIIIWHFKSVLWHEYLLIDVLANNIIKTGSDFNEYWLFIDKAVFNNLIQIPINDSNDRNIESVQNVRSDQWSVIPNCNNQVKVLEFINVISSMIHISHFKGILIFRNFTGVKISLSILYINIIMRQYSWINIIRFSKQTGFYNNPLQINGT